MTDETPEAARDADARLAAWFEALARSGAASGASAPAASDPARIAAHLDGAADEALLDAAADDPDTAALLADVVATRDEAAAAPRPVAPLPASVRDAALALIRARVRGRAAGRSLAAGPGRWGWRAALAAAGVVVAGAAALWFAAGLASRDAGRPSITVAGVERLHRDGRLEAGGEQRLGFGAVVAPDAGERVAVALPGGGRVVLGDDDVVEVACDPAGGDGCERAALALTRGEALVAAGGATTGGAVLLLPGTGRAAGMGRLEVTAGAVHVALGAATVAEVALRADGRVRFTAPGLEPREWSGPGRLALRGGAGDWDAAGAAAASLFRDLEFFGGAPVSARPDRRVSARSFTVLEADGGARPSDGGAPALRFDLGVDRQARLAWTLDEVAADARSVRLLVRVQPRFAGPGGAPLPDTPFPRVVFEVEGVPGATATWEVPQVHSGPPRAARTLVLPWPAEAVRPRAGQPVVVRVRAERAPVRVWFDGAAFSFVPASATGGLQGE
ncbi:MAG: hypothetical protein U1E39_18030 [Planctomycetota bacterium]